MGKFDLDVVFLGGLFPEPEEKVIILNTIGQIDNAANNLQWKLVNGFDANLISPVKIVNSLYIGSYPKKYRKPFIKSHEFKHTFNSIDENVGFVNIAGIKHFSKYISLKPYLSKWAAIESNKPKVIVAYALTNIFVELLFYVKKLNSNIITVIIVPDLPQYMNTSNNDNLLLNVFKSLSLNHIKRRIDLIDCFVLLTKYMVDSLKISDKQTVIVEGIADDFENVKDLNYSSDITIAYTGTLNSRYGILNLIDAFKMINNNNYKLILCGAGDSEALILDAVREDKRIQYVGQLSKKETIKLQEEATILVNPRQNIEEFTKYSFPSKIMEYLSRGKPVIAYKLDGIPDEYDTFIHYVKENSIESLKNKIVEVAEQTSEIRMEFGKRAQNWVLQEKNCITQTEKIIKAILKCQKDVS